MQSPLDQIIALMQKFSWIRDWVLSWIGYRETDKAIIPAIGAAGKFLEMIFEIVGALFQTFAGRCFFAALAVAAALMYGRFYYIQQGHAEQAALDRAKTMATVRVYLERAQAIEHRVCPDAPPLIREKR